MSDLVFNQGESPLPRTNIRAKTPKLYHHVSMSNRQVSKFHFAPSFSDSFNFFFFRFSCINFSIKI